MFNLEIEENEVYEAENSRFVFYGFESSVLINNMLTLVVGFAVSFIGTILAIFVSRTKAYNMHMLHTKPIKLEKNMPRFSAYLKTAVKFKKNNPVKDKVHKTGE